MADASLRILLCGDFEDDEMRRVADFAEKVSGTFFQLHFQPLLPFPAESPWTPDLIVIAQQRPDQYSQSAVRRLQALYPLARCICCQSAWCESDGRNSSLWPDAVRVSARTAISRIHRELEVLQGQHTPLPLTASHNEIFEFDSPGDWISNGNRKPVLVKSPDCALRQTIEDLLTSGGFDVVRAKEIEPAAIVWDADPWHDDLAAEIDACCRKYPQARLIALMNFGHPHAVARAKACGVHTVVPKLGPADILLAELTHGSKS